MNKIILEKINKIDIKRVMNSIKFFSTLKRGLQRKDPFIKSYIVPFVAEFLFLMFLLHFTFRDYSNVITIISILIPTNIAILVVIFSILFLFIQFTMQRYSPRTLAMVIFKSPDTIFIAGAYLFSICFGIILLGNTWLIRDSFVIMLLGNTWPIKNTVIINAFISLSVTTISLALFYLNRLIFLIRPEVVISMICKNIRKKIGFSLSSITNYYKADPIRYPLNIPPEDDMWVPLFNIVEGALASHDLATIMGALKELEKLLEDAYSCANMTEDAAVALTQYICMHLTRLTEMIPALHEDDVYQDIFKIQNLLVIKNSENGFFEAYKWSMITYYYCLKFIKQEESDYPLRIAIFNISKLVELETTYNEKQLPLFLDTLNYLSSITPTSEERSFQEPMEQWLMGMKSKNEAIVDLHRRICERIKKTKRLSLIRIYIQKLFERFISFEEFVLKDQTSELLAVLLKDQDKKNGDMILSECLDKVAADHPTNDKITSLKNIISNLL